MFQKNTFEQSMLQPQHASHIILQSIQYFNVLCVSSDPVLLQSCATGKVSDLYLLSEGKWAVGARLNASIKVLSTLAILSHSTTGNVYFQT